MKSNKEQKMKAMKKLAARGLCLAFGWLVAAGLCGSAWAEPASESDFEFDSATGTITGYKGAGGDVEIPAQIGGVDVKAIGENAFFNYNVLTNVTIPAGVTNIGTLAFESCLDLTNVTFAAGSQLKNIGELAFRDCKMLASVVFPAGCLLESIGNSAFIESGLTGIAIPAGVTSIGDGAFRDCSGLVGVTFADGSQLTTIGKSAFYQCTALTAMTIPAGVTSIGDGAFRDCSGLVSVTFADGSQLATIGNSAFNTCTALTAMTIPAGVTYIGEYAFTDCGSLTSMTIPAGVTIIMDATFMDCSSLTSVTIPAGVTSIKKQAFLSCSLTEVTIPESVTNIERLAFCACPLTGITLPEVLTDIGDGAFQLCTNLTEITIPAGVTNIGMAAFALCSNLTEVTVLAIEPPAAGDLLFAADASGNPIASLKAIKVPAGSVDKYKKAPGWDTYTALITDGSTPAADYLRFTARGGAVTIGMEKEGEIEPPALETASDPAGPWTAFTAGTTTIPLAADQTVYFRRSETTPIMAISKNKDYYWTFTMTPAVDGATVEAGGNVMSLLDQTCAATAVGDDAFRALFRRCTVLTTAPALPATTLADSCYQSMFDGCGALATAPALPAMTLVDACYARMFQDCTSLTTAPELLATTLAEACYYEMFNGCEALSEITMLATDISASECLDNWVKNVAPTGVFKKNPEMTALPTGNNGIPEGWTVEDVNPGTEKIQRMDFSLRVVDFEEDGVPSEATVTIHDDAPLADGEIWAWASFSMDGDPLNEGLRARADAVWANLNAKIGAAVGSVNLADVTNGLEAVSFGTFTSSPHDFQAPDKEKRFIFARAKADGTILAVGGVKSTWKFEGGATVSENEMFGTGTISVAYYAWDESAGDVVPQEPVEAIQLTDEITELEDGKWYVAIGQWKVNREITVHGSAHLICWKASPTAHGAEVDFTKKVTIGANAALSIYGMSKMAFSTDIDAGKIGFSRADDSEEGVLNPTVDATGAINIHGTRVSVSKSCGNWLHSGTINVYGGALQAYADGDKPAIRVDSALNVYGGWVSAKNENDGTGAAIGGAAGQDGCTVNVYGGWVEAHGGEGAAGIGAGAGGASHGELTVGEGVSVWVAEDEDSTKYLKPNYKYTRERHVWITTCSEKVKFQKFTATVGESKITLKMPSEPGDGYCYGVLKMSQACARCDARMLAEADEYVGLADLVLDEYTQKVEAGSLLVGEMSFAELTSQFDMLAAHLFSEASGYTVEFFYGDTVELDLDGLDAMFVCRVEDNANHGIASIGGCTLLADLPSGESKGDEMSNMVEVEYYAWNGTEVAGPLSADAIPVTADTTELNSGWYVVQGVVSNFTGITVYGDAHLILADGAELYAKGADSKAGIEVGEISSVTNSLSIYGQAEGTGKLTAVGGSSCAGIGGSFETMVGVVTIHGGTVTAIGTSGGAGIGSCDGPHEDGCTGVVTINGGTVTAIGGELGCAGIGGYTSKEGCTVTINGGLVTAVGGGYAAGIGGGNCGAGGMVTISGGIVSATGDLNGAAGIGGGQMGDGGMVTITGGKVTATGGRQGAGIGGGVLGDGGAVTITGGDVEAISYSAEYDGAVSAGEGIGAGFNAYPDSPLSSGTLNLDGYAGVKIFVGMNTNDFTDVTEVNKDDYLDREDVIGWHTNLYVHIMASATPEPEGTPENPWKVGAVQPEDVLAYTNGNGGLVITGKGPIGDRPWTGDDIKGTITEAYIGPGVTVTADDFTGLEALAKIVVPHGQGEATRTALGEPLAALVVELPNYLAFTARGGTIDVKMKDGGDDVVALEWASAENPFVWSDFVIVRDQVAVSIPADKTIYLRHKGPETIDTFKYWRFTFVSETEEARVEASGNVMSLLDQTCQKTSVGEYAFNSLFYAPEDLDESRLTSAPELPAMTLADYCYMGMFNGCTLLTNAPALPATELAVRCYKSMFYGCTSLTDAPELPATVLSTMGYEQMFVNCTSLTNVPRLAVREFGMSSANGMFRWAEKLNALTVEFDSWPDGSTGNWLDGVAETGVFTCPIELPVIKDVSHIPVGWNVKKRFTLPGPTGAGSYVVSNALGQVVEPIGTVPGGNLYEVPVTDEKDVISIYVKPSEGHVVRGKNPLTIGLIAGGSLDRLPTAEIPAKVKIVSAKSARTAGAWSGAAQVVYELHDLHEDRNYVLEFNLKTAGQVGSCTTNLPAVVVDGVYTQEIYRTELFGVESQVEDPAAELKLMLIEAGTRSGK